MSRGVERGFSLAELLIASSISLLITAGALKAFGEIRALYRSIENIAALEERAVFALRLLEEDITRAGYFGLHADGRLLTADPDISAHCNGLDVTNWVAATASPVAGNNAAYDLPCPARFAHVSGTDTLTLRFADSEPADPEANGVIVVTGLAGGVLANASDREIDTVPVVRRHLQIAAWYVGSGSSESGSPALYRQRLRDDGLIETQEIMPGIEDLQIRFAIDSDGDGRADQELNPDITGIPGATIVSASVQLRLATPLPEQGHFDNGPWASIDPGRVPFQPRDKQRRISVTRSFIIRNHQGAA